MSDFDRVFRRREGEMSVKEAEKFDEELLENKSLAAEYAQQEKEDKLLSFAAAEDFGDYLDSLPQPKFDFVAQDEPEIIAVKPEKKTKLRILFFAAAASFLILVVTLGIYFNNKPAQNVVAAQELYDLPIPPLDNVRSADSYNDNLSLLKSDNQKEVEKAITYFKSQTSNLDDAYYLIGHGEYRLANYQESVSAFASYLSVSKKKLYKEQAEYYRIVSSIAAGDYQAAKNSLTSIRKGHPFEKYLDAVKLTLSDLAE